jgi:acyl-CoA synthetase (AMP-forming)/AMP-acid ligase II
MIEAEALTGVEEMPWAGEFARLGATLCPDRLALIVPEDSTALSYRELDRRVGRALALLAAAGCATGDRIGYLGRNRDLFFVLLIAAMRGGYILMPLNWRCHANEIAWFLADSAPRLLFCDREFEPLAAAASAGLSATPDFRFTRAGDAPESVFANAVEADGPTIDSAIPHGETPCMLFYTSGTSGRPKGVVSTHYAFSVMRQMEVIAPDFPAWKGETTVSAMPVFHIAGTTWPMMGLMRQSTVVLTSDPSAPNLVRLIRDHDAARTFAVPTIIREIVREVRATGTPLPSLRMFLYGAMPIGESLLRDAMDTLGCDFLQYYGMTEATGSVTFLAPRYHSLERPELMQSVGRIFPGSALDIRDAEDNAMPPGTPGEIVIQTPTLMQGYWNQPEATELATRGGWYRSGDGGYVDAEGFVYLTDRIKDMVVSGGENIYPAEVEEVLRQHPAIQEAVLIGRPDERWGEAAVALVEIAAGQQLVEEEVIAFCKGRIASYKAPKTVVGVPQLPRTASGKLQRAQAKREFLAGRAPAEV